MSKRSLKLYLSDVLDAAESIEKFTSGMRLEDFRSDRKTYNAVLWEFQVIGEAAKHIEESEKNKEIQSSVPWREMVDARNKITHEYFGIDVEEIWYDIEHEIPYLKKHVRELLKLYTDNKEEEK